MWGTLRSLCYTHISDSTCVVRSAILKQKTTESHRKNQWNKTYTVPLHLFALRQCSWRPQYAVNPFPHLTDIEIGGLHPSVFITFWSHFLTHESPIWEVSCQAGQQKESRVWTFLLSCIFPGFNRPQCQKCLWGNIISLPFVCSKAQLATPRDHLHLFYFYLFFQFRAFISPSTTIFVGV